MKSLKTGLLALALTIGIAGAFATSTKTAKNFDNPNWQTEDASGNIVSTDDGGVYDPNRTLAQAQADYGCAGTGSFCAVTVDSENGSKTPGAVSIKHN
jgi:hypothetical protein